MAEPNGPRLLMVGGDPKRLQWLTHHVTSHWPAAQITIGLAQDAASLAHFAHDRPPDAVILHVDFGSEALAGAGLDGLARMLRAQPSLHCIVLAEHGDEMSAVRALKSGARDYLPLASITRDLLLKAISEAGDQRQAVPLAATAPAATAAEAAEAAPATLFAGYSIIREIAGSAFSSVFLARSERLRRDVVLKVIKRQTAPLEPADAERFLREYDIISSIAHPAIVQIYDFGALARHHYLAMEHIPGGDFRGRLRRGLSIEESRYYLRSIAEALRVIHAFGILHRDLKPANVMLREDDSPVLIDFGAARHPRHDGGALGAAHVVASPFYISPEQSQGFKLDARTDLYSLGVMFYEMLTGHRPYSGGTAIAIMLQHARSPVPTLPAAAALQQALLDRLMAKNPNERYTSADELLADLGPPAADAQFG